MPLDEPTRRLAFLLQRDLRRQVEREEARSERGEEIRYDGISGMAIWETRRGDVIGRWYAEIIASYDAKDRILRWAWAGRSLHASATHAEVIVREAQARNVPQLGMSVVGDLDEEDARTLARMGVLLAQGEGLEVRRGAGEAGEISFVGLFDSPRPRAPSSDPSRYSVPPPGLPSKGGSLRSRPAPRSAHPHPRGATPPPAAPYRSLPPIHEVWRPRVVERAAHAPELAREPTSPPPNATSRSAAPAPTAGARPIREPSRALFVPVATAALATLTSVVPRYQQALFVVTIHVTPGPNLPDDPGGSIPGPMEPPKRRLVVMLVALDESGILRALDPSDELLDAAARMVEADRADGNGPWRKLSARISPKADGGATLNVDVI